MSPRHGPYGLHVAESCGHCAVREERLFCRLSPEALEELNAIRQTSTYPRGAILFIPDQVPRGVHLLCSGSAKVSLSSDSGSAVILRIAEPGELLGLSALVAGTPYAVTAETLEPAEVSFFPRERFLKFLTSRSEVALRAAQQLTSEVRGAHRQVALMALVPEARRKLAGLLLNWAGYRSGQAGKLVPFPLRLTHEEIGELIGSSRETVTRLMNDFRRKGLINVQKAAVTLRNPTELAEIFSGLAGD